MQETKYTSLGFLLAAKTLPILLVALWGGILADRFNRITLALCTIFLTGFFNIATVLAIDIKLPLLASTSFAFISGLASALGAPAIYALLPQLAQESSLFAANGLIRSFRNLGGIISPLIFFPVSLITDSVSAYLSGACSLTSGFIVFYVLRQTHSLKESKRKEEESIDKRNTIFKQQLYEFLSLLKKYRHITLTIIFWMCFLPLQAALLNTVLPAAVIADYTSNHWLIISTLLSIGYVLGGVVTGIYEIKQKLLLPFSIIFFAAPALQIALYSLNNNFLMLAVTALIVGISLELSGVCWGTYMQQQINTSDMGRFSSFDYAASFGLLPAGYLLAGFSMAKTGVNSTLEFGSIVLTASALLGLICFAVWNMARKKSKP